MNNLDQLTQQEERVMELVVRGWRNAKIADELFISIRTVETHLYHVFDKLDVSSRTEATLVILRAKSEIRRNSHDEVVHNSYARDIS